MHFQKADWTICYFKAAILLSGPVISSTRMFFTILEEAAASTIPFIIPHISGRNSIIWWQNECNTNVRKRKQETI